MSRLVIYGTGGFGRDLLTAARAETRAVVFISDTVLDPDLDLTVIHHDNVRPDDDIVVAAGDSAVRRRLSARYSRFGMLVAPTAVVHKAVLNDGIIVCDFTMVAPSARVGRHVHINVYSYLSHDCVVGDFVTIAPRASINGNVHIGDGAYIGTGVVTRQGKSGCPLKIGRNAIVGMGAVVTRDVPDNCVVVGNPARVVRYFPDPGLPAAP